MNIKELLLEGCVISMSYKENPKEWVGETKIHIFEGGCGCEPKIIVEGNYCNDYRIEFEINQIDEAIRYFSDHAFSQENLRYKMNEAVRIISENNPELDLDDKEDLETVMKARELIIKKSE
jgi:hypothetical protein